MTLTSAISNMCPYHGIPSSIKTILWTQTFSDTLLCVYKSMNLNIFSDLRKPGLVPGESSSLSTKIDSILEKKPILHYIKQNEKYP